MKKLIIIFLFLATVFYSCKKSTLNMWNNDIAGTWALKHISGGLAGIDSTVTENITIKFEENGKYTSAQNNAVQATGNYSLTKANGSADYGSETLLNLFFENNNTVTYGITISNDSLFLGKGCCDQFGYLYVRQK